MSETRTPHPGRNQACHCGSGKKYKHCCLALDEARDREARAMVENVENVEGVEPPPAPEAEPAPRQRAPRHQTAQPWKRGAQNTRGFHKFSGPRKVGGG